MGFFAMFKYSVYHRLDGHSLRLSMCNGTLRECKRLLRMSRHADVPFLDFFHSKKKIKMYLFLAGRGGTPEGIDDA